MYNQNSTQRLDQLQSTLPYNRTSEYYITSDTAIASWLHSRGFILSTVLITKTPYTFVFEKSTDLLSAVSDWQKGLAHGNCFAFETSRRTLMRVVKQGKYGDRNGNGE